MAFRSTDPATLELLSDWVSLTPMEVIRLAEDAGRSFPAWAATPIATRCDKLKAVARAIDSHRESLALIATREMGKPIRQSRQELDRCIAALNHIASIAEQALAEEPRTSEAAGGSSVRFEPLGALLAVMPWNFPYWQIIRFCCTALAAGNVVIVKPAPSTAGCALALERCFRDAGLSSGVYATALAEVEDLDALVAHDAIAAVSLTGSVRAGRDLAALAARYGKPAVLELGGSDPFIVLSDADIPAAAKAAAAARCLNAGQSCIAAKRFIATADIYDAFKEAFVAETKKLVVGDPKLETVDIGPLARGDLLETLVNQLLAAKAAGATPLCRGGPRGANTVGYFFDPEILELTSPEGSVWTHETFGPLAALIKADSPDHALLLANDTPFGLGASLWTTNLSLAKSLTPRLQTGNVYINATVRSSAPLPFGGIKDSGFGRELGTEGLRQFTNIKTVWIG